MGPQAPRKPLRKAKFTRAPRLVRETATSSEHGRGCATITAMGESPEIGLARRAWDALIQGGPEALGEVLAPDAQWYGVVLAPWGTVYLL
jgi:hypothetical protein